MTMKKAFFDPHAPTCNVLLVGIHAPYNDTKDIQGYFDEFINLARSNGLETTHTFFMRLREIDPAHFITKGKLEEIKKVCDEHHIDHVVFSEPLSPQQERNLSDYLDAMVFDRTQLILEIFEKNAHSAEGKLQVEIAMLKHKKSRVSGRGSQLSQQVGIIGLRGGPGETAKERDLRHIEEHILKLRRNLEQIDKSRMTQRKRRLSSSTPLICLIGYTNAGKSSILNALTKSDVLAEDKLFATLDTTTRELYIEKTKVGLLSDTVGFIQNLPHHLIEAFKSTLAELQYADLLVEVIDSSDPNWQEHVLVVRSILHRLDLDNKPLLYVFNKIDKVSIWSKFYEACGAYAPHICTSVMQEDGLDQLRTYIHNFVLNLKKEQS